jgi:hypothetical protein
MSMISLRVLAVAAMPLMFACASNPTDNGATGSGGKKGTGGSAGSSSTGGSGGGTSSTGTGGTSSVDSGGTPGAACGLGRTSPTGAVIDNFDGQSQILEWLLADKMNTKGTATKPTGKLTVPVTGMETLALGALASWAMADRPCMDGSQYQGIQFTVSGTVTDLRFRLGTPATYPLTDGGTCTSDATCGYAHYEKKITPIPTAPTMVKVAFSDMTAPWGTPGPFEKSNLVSLIFLTLDTDTTHNFVIDDVSFY